MSNSSEVFKVFIVEDDNYYRELINYSLSLIPDFTVKVFSNGKDFLNHLHENPDVVTLDYRLPDSDGKELLKKIKNYNPEIEVLIISEQEKIETAVELVQAGAYDYIVKSPEIKSRLINSVNHIKSKSGLQKTISTLKKEVSEKYSFENTIIGKSDAIKQVFALMEKALGNNITVSVTGETGTGKEVVAKAIHYNSVRKKGAFVAVNVAAVPKDLIESELFGHEKGAFTGAIARRTGKFEEADGGTLFLDEIGEMDLPMQAKLLRVIQEREFTRIGGNQLIKTDCRLIVATHKNLLEEVKKGNFREDLYYRLLGLQIHLPPLRERAGDIVLLAEHFIQSFCRENKLPPKKLLPDTKKKLTQYPFPGNIRELKSIIELAIVMADTDEINADSISLRASDGIGDIVLEEKTMKEYYNDIIKLYLKKYNNNVLLVADKLDIGKSTIYRLLKEE